MISRHIVELGEEENSMKFDHRVGIVMNLI